MLHLLALLPFLASCQAYFALSQSILEVTRLDPIVNPGTVSSHVHSIAGGSNFDKSMSYQSARAGSCTTAPVTVDMSNYWIPQLYYYKPTDGTYQAIPASGMNAYYLPRAGKDGIVKAFPDGLRMISGSPNRRSYDASDPYSAAISYVCLDYSGSHSGDPAWAQRNNFFAHNCPQGMRAQVNFPPCWDGVNLDSENHQSHMAWPSGGVDGGECPSTHPVRLVSLFYEFIFPVQNFPYNDLSVPTWVWANGDATGYGLHADFVNGWPSLVNGTNILQQAIDGCNANNGVGGELQNCPPFVPYLNRDAGNACRPQNPLVNEDVGLGHYISALPGDNPLWLGNGTKPTVPGYVEGNTTYTNFTSVIPAGYVDVGCVAEPSSGRALTGAYLSNANMTRGVCVAWCQSQGYPLAGVEYGQECRCDVAMRNGASNTTLLPASQCGMTCANNTNENCGGSGTMELFNSVSMYAAVSAAKSVIPAGYVDVGCIAEASSGRALAAASFSSANMTRGACVSWCQSRGYPLAGVEYARECYCDKVMSNGASNTTLLDPSKCNMVCANNTWETCGGGGALELFNNPSLYPAPVSATLPTGWSSNGCMTEPSSARALSAYSISSNSMTTAMCLNACAAKGYKYAGTEYASQCFCANSFTTGSTLASSGDCNMPCAGDSTSYCGGPNRLTTYVSNVIVSSSSSVASSSSSIKASSSVSAASSAVASSSASSSVSVSSTSVASSPAASSSAASSSASTPASSSKPASSSSSSIKSSSSSTAATSSSSAPAASSSAYIGCFSDSYTRTLNGTGSDMSSNSNTACIQLCTGQGYPFAGTENGNQCFCGNYLNRSLQIASTQCSATCPSDSTQKCGGSWAVSVYRTTVGNGVMTGTAPSGVTRRSRGGLRMAKKANGQN